MVEKYSRKHDSEVKLSENFTVLEFACKDGSDNILIDTNLVEALQKIRSYFNTPVSITSAYRNSDYNKKIGGVKNSQHVLGTAADIMINGVNPKEVAEFAESILKDSGGIGLYENFVHIDTRITRSRWQNFGKEVAVDGFFAPSYLSAVEAINILVKKGVIKEEEKWYNGTWNDDDFKWLLRKVGTYINEH